MSSGKRSGTPGSSRTYDLVVVGRYRDGALRQDGEDIVVANLVSVFVSLFGVTYDKILTVGYGRASPSEPRRVFDFAIKRKRERERQGVCVSV